mgnify:CR=1 FL=1
MESVASFRFQVACLRSSMNVILDALDARSIGNANAEFIEKELPLAVEDARAALTALEYLADQLEPKRLPARRA